MPTDSACDELNRATGGGLAMQSPPESLAWRNLPARIKALHVASLRRTGGWLVAALAAERGPQVILDEVVGAAAGVARLRDECFDLVLVAHEPGQLDGLELVAGLRTGGASEALILLGVSSEQEMTAPALEAGADAYLCVNTATTRTLLWTAARAIQRHELVRENRRLRRSEKQRLQQEHLEAERLLAQQRALVRDVEALADGELASRETAGGLAAPARSLPPELAGHYRELLRTYVIMGSGNLSHEMGALAELLVSAGITAQETMLLHVQVLEELVRGLGNRSTRHVMTRADLLVLEVMVHLADRYRQQYFERLTQPRQRLLPGFDTLGCGPGSPLR